MKPEIETVAKAISAKYWSYVGVVGVFNKEARAAIKAYKTTKAFKQAAIKLVIDMDWPIEPGRHRVEDAASFGLAKAMLKQMLEDKP